MAALKIALVCDDSLDKTDGVQQYVLTLGAALTGQGHNVHYLTSTTQRTDLPNLRVLSKNMRVRFNNNRNGMPLPAARGPIKALLEQEQFDIIHVQMPYSPLLAGQIIRASSPRTAVVGTFHVFPHARVMTVGTSLLGVAVRRQLKRFDQIMSVSSAAQAFAKKAFRIESVIVPNMIDLARFTAAKPPKRTSQTPLKIVFLGRLVERKGCLHLLQAVQYMRKHQLTEQLFTVTIGGKGPLLPKLEQYVATHQLSDIVTFEGFVAEADKPDFLASADIAAFPSTGGESFGISLLEAMAATPGVVLAGDNAGYRTVMEGSTNQLVAPTKTDAFAKTLAAYINDPTARKRAHAWQQAHVRQYDIHAVTPQVLGVYRNALRSRRK